MSLRILKLLLPIILILFVIYIWTTDTVVQDNLLYNIDWKYPISFLETKNLYLYIHLFTVIPILALSFDRRVTYYKQWKYIFPSILFVAIPFIIWDVFFTRVGVWGFNSTYITGIHLFNLPIEECFFFITVPFACVFIYECINHYFPKDTFKKLDQIITIGLGILFLIIATLNWQYIYSSTTFFLTSAFLFFHVFFIENTYRTKFYKSYLVSLVPFFIVNGILTGGYTQNPVVIYNPKEYLGLRISSVPIDDAVYGFLLFFLIITLLEYLRSPKK